MIMSKCIKCSNKEHYLKNVYVPTKDVENKANLINLLQLHQTELFYLKICVVCGYTEIYCAKVVDKNLNEKTNKI